jgi:hypothetical protein
MKVDRRLCPFSPFRFSPAAISSPSCISTHLSHRMLLAFVGIVVVWRTRYGCGLLVQTSIHTISNTARGKGLPIGAIVASFQGATNYHHHSASLKSFLRLVDFATSVVVCTCTMLCILVWVSIAVSGAVAHVFGCRYRNTRQSS